MTRSRRHFGDEEKAAVVRRHLVDKVPVSDLCDELDLQPTQIYQWQKQLFDNAAAAFAKTARKSRKQSDQKDRKIASLELRDKGAVHVVEPRFGEPRVSVLTWPISQDEWSTWRYPDELSCAEVVHLMNRYKVTIDELSTRMQITKKRIREVRDRLGLNNKHVVRDWVEAIARPPVPGGVFSLEDHKSFRARAEVGEITADKWKAEFERTLASRMEFLAELQKTYNANQMKTLAGNLGNFGARQNTKFENARAVYRSLLEMFLIQRSFRYDPMRETLEDAVAREVRAIDEAKLNDYFKERGLNRAAHEKAIADPETLDEFRTFVRRRGEEQLTLCFRRV